MININLEKQMNCPTILSLKEVGELIHLKDMESIKRWLRGNNIIIYKLAKLNYVYKVDFECAITLPQVRNFRKEYPMRWESYYRQIIKEDALFNMIMLKLDVEINYQPTTKVKRRSQSDQQLYQKLLS